MTNDLIERLKPALKDRYRLDRQVGQGGMATVFLAEDLKHHRQVALKVLRPELSASLGAERFLREIEVAAQLQHPHIVPLYDSGSAADLLYYVMPYVEGESLRDLIQREGRVSLRRSAQIVREVASGLQYAHEHGVVHRDIKPENIMLSGGHAVVADFGIAHAVDASRPDEANITGTGIAIGTPAYMSPEQATADMVDANSDQYSLACVFYELVTGEQAFSGPTVQAMLTSVLTGPRPRLSGALPDVPPGVDNATQRALATDPKDRYSSVSAFTEALTKESSGVAAATRESRRWRRRAIALPLLVVAMVGAWLVFFGVPGRIVVSGAETIAVVPFTATGPGTEGIGEGMVDILAGNLDGVGGIRTIEPRTVMREWRNRVRGGAGDLDDALAVARSAEAASVLTGSVVTTGGTARLTAELFDINGQKLAGDFVDGPIDSVLTLADGLALKILRQIWSSREPLPSANSSGITSASMPAIRAYLTGERHHRRGVWDSAEVSFQQAVDADSTFSLAWYRLANTLGWQGNYLSERAVDAAENAVLYSGGLSLRMRSLLLAYNLFTKGDPAGTDSALQYVDRFPEDADGWYLLAESQFHTRGYRPLPTDSLLAPFDRVIALDSTLTPAAIHPVELAVEARDDLLLRRYSSVLRSAGSLEQADDADVAGRLIGGDVSAYFQMSGSATGSGVQLASIRALLKTPDITGTQVMSILTAFVDSIGQGAAGRQSLPIRLAGGLGRIDSAEVLLESYASDVSGMAGLPSMASLFGGFADAGALAKVDSQLSASGGGDGFHYFTHALVAYDLGHVGRTRSLVQDGLAEIGDDPAPWLSSALGALDGLAQIVQGDTTTGLAQVESNLRTAASFITSMTVAVQLRYALILAENDATRDDGINRLRYGFWYSPELLPILDFYLARTYESAGKADSAVAR
jgi:tRNA A-37 threonylcarbamoyl transferase component Bud32/TolB-like protein